MLLEKLLSIEESKELFHWILARQNQMQPARIGAFENKTNNTKIRSDSILWMDQKSDPSFAIWSDKITELNQFLRETFYLPIKDSEFHFAHYPEGSFYSKHVDQPKQTNRHSNHNRLVSVVHYLNPEWSANWGGQIVLYTKQGPIAIEPKSPSTLLFQSHKLEHEVLTAKKDRFSLTGWLLA